MIQVEMPICVRWSASCSALLCILSSCIGWGSSSLPPALTDAEYRLIDDAHIPLTVGVVPYKYPAYSDRLLEGLQDTDLFDRVALLDDFETQPDLLAHVAAQIHGTAVFPVLTLLTFGVIPTWFDDDWGYGFWLSKPGAPEERQLVSFKHTGRTPLGWIALLDVVVPSRTIRWDPYKSRRMRDLLALFILTEARELFPASRSTGCGP
jgi:hypothetical protein